MTDQMPIADCEYLCRRYCVKIEDVRNLTIPIDDILDTLGTGGRYGISGIERQLMRGVIQTIREPLIPKPPPIAYTEGDWYW